MSCLKPVTNHPNILEIQHGIETAQEEGNNMFEVRKNDKTGGFSNFKKWLPQLAEMYKDKVVADLFAKKDQFDVVMADSLFNEVNINFLLLFN